MTKEEIKALVNSAIAGQGNQVDAGGALPGIINAIVDAIPEGGASETVMYDVLFNASGPAFSLADESQKGQLIADVRAGKRILFKQVQGGQTVIAPLACSYEHQQTMDLYVYATEPGDDTFDVLIYNLELS